MSKDEAISWEKKDRKLKREARLKAQLVNPILVTVDDYGSKKFKPSLTLHQWFIGHLLSAGCSRAEALEHADTTIELLAEAK